MENQQFLVNGRWLNKEDAAKALEKERKEKSKKKSDKSK